MLWKTNENVHLGEAVNKIFMVPVDDTIVFTANHVSKIVNLNLILQEKFFLPSYSNIIV